MTNLTSKISLVDALILQNVGGGGSRKRKCRLVYSDFI